MNPKLFAYFLQLKKDGLSEEREKKILVELNAADESHDIIEPADSGPPLPDIYSPNDLAVFQNLAPLMKPAEMCMRSIDELLDKDKQREEDGFPRKIRVGRLVKPRRGGKDKVVVVPTTVEEKFLHDSVKAPDDESSSGGAGDGEEGEVIGEQPMHSPDGAGTGAGQGSEGPHEMESNAYDLGKVLTEKFELPNLQNKGKKRAISRYTYEMTDKHRGFGQLLDKKATLRQIVETNISLGRIPDVGNIDPTQFLVAPRDKVYRILSKEKDFESQALVFFMRDYSGSMSGKPTDLIVSQHVMIYSWLLYQYDKQVESRFILHDTEANEVPDFYTYYNSKVAGGTKVASAFRLVNEIVEKDNLAKDYNIYVFHGTDGDDWDTDGKETIPEIKKMLYYTNRVGITIAEQSYGTGYSSEVERYLKKSGLLIDMYDYIRLDIVNQDADEPRLIEGIKRLIS
ncbi:DUF444 family protein [candidate division KSB1 bacterium]|nr:DUF444 family protein [candidate division KSB1 bacterium]